MMLTVSTVLKDDVNSVNNVINVSTRSQACPKGTSCCQYWSIYCISLQHQVQSQGWLALDHKAPWPLRMHICLTGAVTTPISGDVWNILLIDPSCTLSSLHPQVLFQEWLVHCWLALKKEKNICFDFAFSTYLKYILELLHDIITTKEAFVT